MTPSTENLNLVDQWEKIWGSDYGRPEERTSKSRRKITELLQNGVVLKSGMKVLDAGCGDGSTLLILRKEFGVEPFGIDIAPTALKRAEDLNQQENLGATIKEADVRAIPFPDNSFDAVLSYGVIEHFLNYRKAIREFCRVLKPEGQLALVQPHRYSLRHLKMLWLKAKGQWPYGTQINFSGSSLRRVLTDEGFKDIHYFVSPYRPNGLINTLDYNLHRLYKGWGYYLNIHGKKS